MGAWNLCEMTLEEKVLAFIATQPPTEIANVLHALHRLNPQLDPVLQKLIPFPLRTADDPSTGKHFVLSDFNKVKPCCFRSPWSGAVINTTASHLTGDQSLPSPEIRRIEVALNELFMSYCAVYFGSACECVSSVYLWETKDGFDGAFLSHKQVTASDLEGIWDSVHVVRFNTVESTVSCYSSVFCVADFIFGESNAGQGRFEIIRERSIESRKCGRDEESIIRGLGDAVEDNENAIRRLIESVHLEKCLDNIRDRKVGVTADRIFTTLQQ